MSTRRRPTRCRRRCCRRCRRSLNLTSLLLLLLPGSPAASHVSRFLPLIVLLENEHSVVGDLVHVAAVVARHRIKVRDEVLAVRVSRVEAVDEVVEVGVALTAVSTLGRRYRRGFLHRAQ